METKREDVGFDSVTEARISGQIGDRGEKKHAMGPNGTAKRP